MTVPVWPASLPQWWLADGFQLTIADGRQKTNTDAGPGKVRQRYSAAAAPFSGSFIVSPSQLARLDRFWREDTGRGALPFWIRDAVNDGLALETESGVAITTDTGDPILISSWWLARFGEEPPHMVPSGVDWKVSLSLSIMP